MLIKATRIRATAGANGLAQHLIEGDENEEINIVCGTIGGLHDAVEDARRFNRVYALRHFIIAPQLPLSRQQFERAAQALAQEFGFDHSKALIVEHRKARAVADASPLHWHVVVAETHAITGRVLSNSFSHPRHEKIARLLELEFGHPVVPGAHDAAVMAALHGAGRSDLAEQLAGALGRGPKPVAAYSVEAHQAGKRNGIDLAVARQNIRAAWGTSANGDAFRAHIAAHGLDLAMGDKPGVIVIRHQATGVVLGAANRLAGVRRSDFNDFLERTQYDRSNRPEPAAERSADDPNGHAGPAPRLGDHPEAGQGNGLAAGGRGGVGADRDGDAVADDRDQGRAERTVYRSPASGAHPAGHRPGSSPDAGRGLTQAVAKVGASIIALSKSVAIPSPAERTRQHLAGREARARANIAATTAVPGKEISNSLHAARLYRDGTHQRHAEALKSYRAAQERLASHPEPRQSFADRLLGRQAIATDVEALERDVAAARQNLIAAERMAAGGDGNLARVEKSEAAERGQLLGQMEVARRAGMEALGEIVMAQRMARAFPALLYCGPAFVVWSGRRVERKRRKGLTNPWAVNIWGLPIDPG